MIHTSRSHFIRALCQGLVAMATAVLVAVPTAARAASADGTLDTTFNSGQTGSNGPIRAIGFTSDDKVYIAGDFTSYNGTSVGGIARLNSNGQLDTTFNPGGAGLARGSGLTVRSLDVAPDGDVYVAGKFATYNGASVAADSVIRINSDGTLDAGFNAPRLENQYYVGQPATLSMVKVLDDKVFVSGNFDNVYEPASSSTSQYAQGLIALDTTGAIDATFGRNTRIADGMSTSSAYQIVKVPNSTDYYVHGSFRALNSATATNFARVKNDGSRNLDYANSGSLPAVGPNNTVSGMAVQPDGKILLGGNFTTFNGSSTAKGLVRVNPDASLDTSFTSPSTGLIATSLAVDKENRIYIAGGIGTAFTSTPKTFARLKSDGTIDSTFDVSATPDDYDVKVAISPAGKVYVYGEMTKFGDTTTGGLARVNVSSPQAATTTTPTTTIVSSSTSATSAAPGLVRNVRATLNGTTARVQWDAPIDGGAPTTYLATAIPSGYASVSAMATPKAQTCQVAAPKTTCDIKGLTVGKKYLFIVGASNSAGINPGATSTKILTVKAASTLPSTGSSQNMWVMVSAAAMLVVVGAQMRRRRHA